MSEQWHFDPDNGAIEDSAHNPNQIASVMPYNRKVNGPLIAAAPELLKALQDLLRKTSTIECLGEWEALDINTGLRKTNRAAVDAVIKAACDAIDKATKETK